MCKVCGNTITGRHDYHQGPYSIRISGGQTNVLFDIRIIDDSKKERNETFNLYIDSFPYYIKAGDILHSTVTIVDDESKCVHIFTNVHTFYVYFIHK